MGVVFGVLGIGLALIETKLGEATVKVIAAVIWFAVSGICFISRRALPSERIWPANPAPSLRSKNDQRYAQVYSKVPLWNCSTTGPTTALSRATTLASTATSSWAAPRPASIAGRSAPRALPSSRTPASSPVPRPFNVARDDLRNDWNRTAPSSVGICVGTSGVSLTPKTEKNGHSDRQLDSAPAPFLLKAVAASPLPRRPRRPR